MAVVVETGLVVLF